MSKVDKHDAPEGFVAAESNDGCNGCYFQSILQDYPCPRNKHGLRHCISENRIDKCNVVFIQNEELETNTTNFEYFDGEQWNILGDNQIREQQLHGIWICNYVNDHSAVVRSISTLHTFDVEMIKEKYDSALAQNGYRSVGGGWFFVKT